jgi:hypothetical protein
MSRLSWFLACWLLLAGGVSSPAHAQSSEPVCRFKLATGKRGKGFSKLFRDIEQVCGGQVPLCEVETAGGVDNVIALAANKADLGFVQLDAMMEMKASDENIAALEAVLPVGVSLLHIIARSAGYEVHGERTLSRLFLRETKLVKVEKLSDLRGLPVAVVGSAQLLMSKLNRELGYGLRLVFVDTDDQARAQLEQGAVAAWLTASIWPNGPVAALDPSSGFTLASFDAPMQAPYIAVHKNYQNLGVYNQVFLGVPNLLVARHFSAEGPRGHELATLQRCILSHLTTLQEGEFEPSWKDIKNAGELYGWRPFRAAQ